MMRLCNHSKTTSPTASAVPKTAHAARVSSGKAGVRVQRQLQLRPQCMQAGAGPGPGMAGRQPQMGAQDRAAAPAPLARRPSPYAPAQPIYLELSQVLGKQVITRTSGRALGTASAAWLDPARCQVVSLDLDERRALSSTRIGNIPLSALRQIGDVVLVHDEGALYEQDLDGRLGFVNPVGLEVRTRSGEFLGKVRDVSFSPDNGEVARLVYDEFGLASLPLQFFDCYSVSAGDILSIGRNQVIVFDDAKYRERKESNGVFAAIPALLKTLGSGSRPGPQLALPAASTSDAYRLGSGATASSSTGYLPADYSYEQWQRDLRRWEEETGMTYEQYLRSQQLQTQAAPRAALPPAGRQPAAGGYAYSGSPYEQPQQQQQQPARYAQQQRADYGGQYGARPAAPAQDFRYRTGTQQQPQQQPAGRYGPAAQPGARQAWGAPAPVTDPRQRTGTPAPGPAYTTQQPPQQQQGGYSQRVQQPAQQQQQQQQPQQQVRPPTQQQQQPQRQAPQQQVQQPQQPMARGWEGSNSSNGSDAGGRRLDDWIDRESSSRPRMAEVLAEGLSMQAGSAASQQVGSGNGGWDGVPAQAPAVAQEDSATAGWSS